MNERLPYEQHLAEKLQQLPPPLEPDKAWEQMKVLLDDELPRGSGFNGGNSRWWIIGMIAGILFIGSWWFMQQPGKKTATKELTAIETPDSGPGKSVADRQTGQANAQNNERPESRSDIKLPETGARKFPPPRDPVIADKDVGLPPAPAGKIINHHQLPAYTENATQIVTNNKLLEKKTDESGISPIITQSTTDAALTGSIPEGTTIHQPDAQTDLLLTGKMPAAWLPAGTSTNNYKAANAVALKKLKGKSDNMDRAFAIGFSLPLAFPVADQKALGYNFRGGANTVSDYIPSPHVQYHLNKRTFFQTEIQVIAPQYIRPVLLYQEKSQPSPGTLMYNSVYAKKLYYFNIPVSVYHSPMPNFFLGTGLQFSSLVSGVGMYENKRVYNNQETVLNQVYNRISHDSLGNRMNNTELRLLLDVNYYWQKFTVGLRYNQAFGNYIGFRLDNTTGYTYDKNKALFFYLRYNIWEDRKRKQPAKSLLSLK